MNYAIDSIIKENSTLEKFNGISFKIYIFQCFFVKEIIEMEEEEEANKLLSACSRLVLFIAKNKFENFSYKAMMELLLLDKEKKELINQVIYISMSFLKKLCYC